ncbi:MAG TPA: UxaA family hydrolase [Rhizobiaceae bacterium]|nr:UxaA family hydrolase [Rhizobiaceae bacterium]
MVERTFLGFSRPRGRAGTRNHLLVLGINGLIAATAARAASALPFARLVATPYGRGQFGPDKECHFRQLAGIGANPNNGAVLIIGVDRKSADDVAAAVSARAAVPIEVLTLDDTHEDALELGVRAIRAGASLSRDISRARREAVPLSELYLGLECGHSDASSGLAANPLAGALADRLVDAGGTIVIGETIEWLGAEHALSPRGVTPETGEAIVRAVAAREAAVSAAGIDLIGNNPGQENIRGGLSTIEEKSLGAIAKAGTRPIIALLSFAEPPRRPGLHLMDGPSFSPESMTGFVASGTQMILFTTGPGNSYCSLLAPTIKISANPAASAQIRNQFDFDASRIFEGRETLDAAADRLLDEAVAFASGMLTWGEAVGEGAECFTRIGASL